MKPYKRGRLRDWAFAITRPTYWMSNYKSSQAIDDLVNAIIDNNLIEEAERYTSRTKSGIRLWTSNYPYCYGLIYGGPDLLPYRRTRKRLKDYLDQRAAEVILGNRGANDSKNRNNT